jgi:hypothetical protein
LHIAGCRRQKYAFESELPQAWPGRMYSLLPECGAWQSAAHLRAVCQGVIPAVANRRIWARSLAIGWILLPTILHREAHCLMCYYFLTRDFSSVKLIHSGLFRPKLNTNCLRWHTISWHYTSKVNTIVQTAVSSYLLQTSNSIPGNFTLCPV